MQAGLERIRQVVPPRFRGNSFLAAAAILAVAVSLGLLYWNSASKVYHLRLGAGVELKYRTDLLRFSAKRQPRTI